MNDESSKKHKVFSWIDNRIIGPLLTSLIVATVTGKIVIRISGVQLSIGLTVLVIVCIYVAMGLSFTLGMFYMLFGIGTIFTKKKPPLFMRPFAVLALPFLHLANWISKRRYEAFREKHPHPPSELAKRLSVKLQEKKEKKSDTSSSNL